MDDTVRSELKNGQAVALADGVFWVGFFDAESGLHCNPYMIVDHDEAVVIDSGSRPDFPTVMMKILQSGVSPGQIKALVYQHYDPDLCGSVPNFEDIIRRKDLKVISGKENLMFIRHYSVSSQLVPLEDIGFEFTFGSGRRLSFIETPYAHSSGSFVTFDAHSGVLFSSDLFGSYGNEWELFLHLTRECIDCVDLEDCPLDRHICPVRDILEFHRSIMPSKKALRLALERIGAIPFQIIAPQHGSIIADRDIQRYVFDRLAELEKVGVDGIVADDHRFDLSPLRERAN